MPCKIVGITEELNRFILDAKHPLANYPLTLTFSFSNRYFPPKVVNLWVELHEFERMGYVPELMIRAGFKDLHTYSLRGLPRPADDR
ncbi:MAG: hypothetical protein RMI93_02520 [Caldimicrobium sp.]|nr:hypothetical protein [Caldimicrobium sp.]MDW8182466.1 hypothetical protein [Caldimicrobium sp.]